MEDNKNISGPTNDSQPANTSTPVENEVTNNNTLNEVTPNTGATPNVNTAPNNSNNNYFVPNYSAVPNEYKPISAWGYFGYEILFAIPLIGFILLLVFALGGTQNINLKNFARSYFCIYAIIFIIAIIIFLLFAGVFGGVNIGHM